MSKSNESVAAIKNTQAPTTEKAARAAHEAVDETAARAEKLEAGLRTRADRAGTKVRDSRDTVEQQFGEKVADVESFVKGRPFTAAGIAFAAGVVVSTLFRR